MMTDTKQKVFHVFVKAAHFIFSFKKVCFNENNSAAATKFLRTGIQLNFVFPQNCKNIFFGSLVDGNYFNLSRKWRRVSIFAKRSKLK